MGISRFPDDARLYVSYAEMLVVSPDATGQRALAEGLLLGQIALDEGQLKEAEKDLLRSLSFDPDRSKTHFALPSVYRLTGRAEEAAKELESSQKLKEE